MIKVEIVKVAYLADKNVFYQLINIYLYLLALFELNTFIKYNFANILKTLPINLFSLSELSA